MRDTADPARIVACLALLALSLLAAPLSLFAAVIAASAVLVAVATADSHAEPLFPS